MAGVHATLLGHGSAIQRPIHVVSNGHALGNDFAEEFACENDVGGVEERLQLIHLVWENGVHDFCQVCGQGNGLRGVHCGSSALSLCIVVEGVSNDSLCTPTHACEAVMAAICQEI